MPQLSSYIPDGSIPEDLVDVLENIDPVETPLFSMTANVRASDTTHIWMTDSLAAAAVNAQIEGSVIGTENLGMPTRESNTTQIMRKEFQVTDTQEAVRHLGMPGAIAYQMGKAMKELARDTEISLIQGAGSAGTATAARQMSGLATSYTAFNGAAATQQVDGATLLEAGYNTMAQTLWNNGVRPDTVLVDGWGKRQISAYATNITRNIGAAEKKQILSVMQYDGDFGVQDIILERYVDATSTLGNDAYMFSRSLLRNAWLRGTRSEMQARRGDATPGMVDHELTLQVGNPASVGIIAGVGATTL